jgi:molybdopterin/thiamine biosynthesis adenylyltransferase
MGIGERIMDNKKEEKKKIRAVMPNYASFDIEYENDEDLKSIICGKFEIEAEFTNLIFIEEDGDISPINYDDLDEYSEEDEKDQIQKVVVDYIWARQMIVLKEGQKKLRSAKALVVGAGALGNEIVKNLAWLGIGEIILVDFDKIELSNVSRGLFEKDDIGKNKSDVLALKLGKNSPYVKIHSIAKRVEECSEEQLSSDVILSALDNMPTRVWLASYAVGNQIPLVDGGIKEFQGRVQTYHPNGPCLACNIPLDRYAEIMELRNPCEGYDEGAVASFTTISSIIAGIQANEAMKLIVGLPTLKGVLLMDFLKNNYQVMPLEKNAVCFVCGKDNAKTVSVNDHDNH